jgi:hypothetical protein
MDKPKQTFWARSGWARPPNHVVITMNGYGTPMVLITLFGEDSHAVPLGDPSPHGGVAWVLYTHERTSERLDANDFVTRIVAAVPPPPFNPRPGE